MSIRRPELIEQSLHGNWSRTSEVFWQAIIIGVERYDSERASDILNAYEEVKADSDGTIWPSPELLKTVSTDFPDITADSIGSDMDMISKKMFEADEAVMKMNHDRSIVRAKLHGITHGVGSLLGIKLFVR